MIHLDKNPTPNSETSIFRSFSSPWIDRLQWSRLCILWGTLWIGCSPGDLSGPHRPPAATEGGHALTLGGWPFLLYSPPTTLPLRFIEGNQYKWKTIDFLPPSPITFSEWFCLPGIPGITAERKCSGSPVGTPALPTLRSLPPSALDFKISGSALHQLGRCYCLFRALARLLGSPCLLLPPC